MPPKLILVRRATTTEHQEEESSSLSTKQQQPTTTTTTTKNFSIAPHLLVTIDTRFSHLNSSFSQEFLDLNLHRDLELVPVGNSHEQADGNNNNSASIEVKLSHNPANPFSSLKNEAQERKQLELKYKMISHTMSSTILPVIFRVLTNRLPIVNNNNNNNNCNQDQQQADDVLEEVIESLNDSKISETLDSAVYTLVQDCVAIEFCVESNALSLVSHWRSLVSKFCSVEISKIVEEIETNVVRKFILSSCHQSQKDEKEEESDEKVNTKDDDNRNKNTNASTCLESDQSVVRTVLKPRLEALFSRFRRFAGAQRHCQRDLQHLLNLCRTTRLQSLKNFASGEALLYQLKIIEGDLLRDQNQLLVATHALHQTLTTLAKFVHEKFFLKNDRNNNNKKNNNKHDDDDNNNNNNNITEYQRPSQLPFTPAEIDRLVGIRSSEIPNQGLVSFFPSFQKYQDAMIEAPYRGTAYHRLAVLCLRFPVFGMSIEEVARNNKLSREFEDERFVAARESRNVSALNICYWLVRGVCCPVDSADLFDHSVEKLKKFLKTNVKDVKRISSSSVSNSNGIPVDAQLLAISYEIFSHQLKKVVDDDSNENIHDTDSSSSIDLLLAKWKTRFQQRCLENLPSLPDKFFIRFTILFVVLSLGNQKLLLSLFDILLTLFLEKHKSSSNNDDRNNNNDNKSLKESSSSLSTSISLLSATINPSSSSSSSKTPFQLPQDLRIKILAVRDFCDRVQLPGQNQLFDEFEKRMMMNNENSDFDNNSNNHDRNTKIMTIVTSDDRELFGIPKRGEKLGSMLLLLKKQRYSNSETHQITATKAVASGKNSVVVLPEGKLIKKWLNACSSSSSLLFAVEKISVEEYRENLSQLYRVGLHRHDPKFIERMFTSHDDEVCLRLIRLSRNLSKLLLA